MTARGNPTAVAVKALDDYKLLVSFENDETRVYDLKPALEGMQGKWYGELLDNDYFRMVRIGGGSVEWPNEQDVCPDCLYEDSIPFVQEETGAPA
jgi:hypothetical protein